MEILKQEELIKKAKEYNLIPIEVRSIDTTNKVILNVQGIEDFLEMANSLDSVYIYYLYNYYNKASFIVPEEEYKYEEKLQKEIKRYNKEIECIDFNVPYRLILFMIQNGTFIGIELFHYWTEEMDLQTAEIVMDTLESEFYSEVKSAKSKKREQRKEDEEKLREFILNDPEFPMQSKNQDLRYWYLADLLDQEEMKPYRYLVEPFGIPHTGKAKVFMDITFMLYKEKMKNKS
ncbi:hypothetical protein D4T97_005195 [Siminovitchia acidinfaciens]|uniref:Uncharacterized protein n=1 Tax=Siminovitchia acidinfaciens TaxID=2321395 RepID=A0A429Y441_9BACI|nr:hypothetical protein [Siminovitchia acidinfaciens]RST76180.1 hypothetical protein D4T97_005195 [Siminovitchia acidinfaciens]